jgi:prolycopene isomerase
MIKKDEIKIEQKKITNMGLITSDRILKSKYDVIVIGAGLGGLTTASLLAKRGIDVLLIEQHALPGGACTSFRREGRIYDSGCALIFGFGTEGYHLHRNLINLLEEPITVIPRDKFFRLDFAGERILFWKNLAKFLPELQSHFPDQREEIRALYEFLIKFYNKYMKDQDLLTPPSELSDKQKMKMFFSHPLRVLGLMKLLSQSAENLMKPYLKSQKIIEFYDKLCASYAYINMRETPAIMALTMFTDNHIGGTYYLAGSAQTYSNTLERAIERNGGTVVYHEKVEQIYFNGERAAGVKLSDGRIIYADRVVSDTTVWNLYDYLIPQEKVTSQQHQWANSLISTYPAMVLYAAVEKAVFPADTQPVEYFINNRKEIDMGDITMYIPTVDDHSLGLEDEHIVTVFSPAPNMNWPRPSDKEYQSKEYYEKKQKQADLILDEIEKRFPKFRLGIRKLYIATPSTIERYTLKTKGCVGGPKQMIGQELTKRLPARTPWPGVFACGDSTTMGMGTPAVIASGFGAANVILRELGKPEYYTKKFEQEFVSYITENPRPTIPEKFDGTVHHAQLIARECQHCEKPACKIACPAGIDIPGFIRRIESGNFKGAAKLIREINPFAEICGTICPADHLCEKYCIRLTFSSKPVRIKELEQWVGQTTGKEGWTVVEESPSGKKIAIVGAGPAGLSCAYYLARLGYKIDIFDALEKMGGRLNDLIKIGKISNEALDRELSGLISSLISFHGNWTLTQEDQLKDLAQKYDGVFVSVKKSFIFASEKIVNLFPTVIVGEAVKDMSKTPYEVIHAVRDGRQAAITLHNMFS